jgi:hypothetical protein
MINFDLSVVDAQDEGELVIRHPRTLEPTGWTWTFYGPGHAATIELANRVGGAALKKAAARRQAQANGKKWKEDEQSLEEIRVENVDNIVARTKGFTPIKLNGELIEFVRMLHESFCSIVRRAGCSSRSGNICGTRQILFSPPRRAEGVR